MVNANDVIDIQDDVPGVDVSASRVWKRVGDIMTRNVTTIDIEKTIADAARIMSNQNISSIVVVCADEVAGILTERDLLRKIVVRGKNPKDVPIREIMPPQVVCAHPDILLFTASKLMKEGNFRRLPIIENKKLLGIVTQDDISDAMDAIWKKVEDIMTKVVITIDCKKTVADAARIMADKNISSIVVTDNDEVVGILTERDFLRKIVAYGKDPESALIQDIMTPHVVCAHPDTTIFKASKLMKEGNFRRLPIIDNKKLVGIVTQDDLTNAMGLLVGEISPVTEERSKEQLKHTVNGGTSYMINEEKPIKSNEIFQDLVTHGVPGLYIARTLPAKVRERYGLKKTPILWLSRTKEYKEHINPVDLVQLGYVIREFIKKSDDSVVLLEGIEYLITQNSFEEILQFIQSLNDSIALSHSRLIVPMDSATLSTQQHSLMKKEMAVLENGI